MGWETNNNYSFNGESGFAIVSCWQHCSRSANLHLHCEHLIVQDLHRVSKFLSYFSRFRLICTPLLQKCLSFGPQHYFAMPYDHKTPPNRVKWAAPHGATGWMNTNQAEIWRISALQSALLRGGGSSGVSGKSLNTFWANSLTPIPSSGQTRSLASLQMTSEWSLCWLIV